ncbi:MAG: hypothetical protein M3Q37_09035 [Gemmatimonadota bacterium]|nr:hypothetical protein [Gemmatimonadota bacterium]
MRCRSLLPSIALLMGALVLGCTEIQEPTSRVGNTSTLSPAFARGGSGGGGAILARGSLLTGFLIVDEERGLTSIIGVPADEIAGLIDCGGTGETEPLGILSVTRPTGAIKFLLKSEESTVLVWQFVSFDLCGVLATTPPYAEGTARVRLTDNDVEFPILPGGNAATTRAVGSVTVAATGEELGYRAFVHSLVKRGGTSFDDIRFIASKIILR